MSFLKNVLDNVLGRSETQRKPDAEVERRKAQAPPNVVFECVRCSQEISLVSGFAPSCFLGRAPCLETPIDALLCRSYKPRLLLQCEHTCGGCSDRSLARV